MIDVNPASETVLRAPWVVFASGQGLREEYDTTASAGVGAALEAEISTLCREFHNSLGVQEVPEEFTVALFWKARQSSHWVITQVERALQQPGQRIAYEYFSLTLTERDLHKLGKNPLRAMELFSTQELRKHYTSGRREPISAAVTISHSTPAVPPFQNGTWPATEENRKALVNIFRAAKLPRELLQHGGRTQGHRVPVFSTLSCAPMKCAWRSLMK